MTSGGMAPFLESTTTPKEEPMPRPHTAMRKISEVLRLRLGVLAFQGDRLRGDCVPNLVQIRLARRESQPMLSPPVLRGEIYPDFDTGTTAYRLWIW